MSLRSLIKIDPETVVPLGWRSPDLFLQKEV